VVLFSELCRQIERIVNKTALYAITLAALIPLISYFVVKRQSEKNVLMPRHFLPDSTTTVVRNGKQYTDTAWHRLPDFKLTNQLGQTITWNELKGKVVVADFFFTHCPTICPGMTLNMRRLQQGITNSQRVGDKTPDFVHYLSISIDPERDSVERLKFWADKYQINPETWWLLTGDKKEIYDFVINHVKLGLVDGDGVDSNFIHSDRFVLIDTFRHVRGYYRGLDTADLARLSNDIILLSKEKDPNRKSFFAGKLEIMAVAFLAAIIGVGLLIYFIKRKPKDVSPRLDQE
jgi:protein SCO1/2